VKTPIKAKMQDNPAAILDKRDDFFMVFPLVASPTNRNYQAASQLTLGFQRHVQSYPIGGVLAKLNQRL
jgi:hypothetical protein